MKNFKHFFQKLFGITSKKKPDLNAIEDLNQDLEAIQLHQTHIHKQNTVYKRTRMSNFGLKLSFLYGQFTLTTILLITIATAIVFGVVSVFLVKNVGIYNFGLAAFGQAAAKIIVVNLKESQVSQTVRNLIDQFVFWIAYVILSIPIFYFGYKKVGVLFTNLTVLFLVVSSVVSFSLGLIPGVNSTYIIGDFSNQKIKDLLPDYSKALSSLIPLLWDAQSSASIIALMIYSIVYGVVLAYVFAIIQIIGGTAGVTGVIGEWYANAKQKSFGQISGYMNIIIVIIAVFVGSYLPGRILLAQAGLDNAKQMEEFGRSIHTELYFSPNLVATILVNVVYIMVLDKLFPKFKLVRVQVFSHKSKEIQHKIVNDPKIVTGLTIFKAKGGHKNEEIDVLTSISLFRHVLRIIKDVRSVDNQAFIVISDVKSIDGNIYLPETKF
ncbi:DUF2179 domain-containing protein [Mycoplasma nasistruthionis]|uniref:YitT family protein n=1 Tax=Mycoplasma nasistruthionis TaxID=353852 RepID=A0A4Y6I653_9MOLU|nr:DUF2179 domain-containing protein [Mycoplasma nasistruthionis]QCZ36488.1 YitT family protein [Mycoplasma nasistruthionis]QDF64780.1 YitT family protein [Mycoplasma nasistruthionis]